MLKTLKITAILEGISLLLLFGVAMPLKYMFDEPLAVEIVGMAHGILFIAYIIFVFFIGLSRKWKLTIIGLSMLASIIPFGTFYADKKWFH
jgi:integral membrane protein